MDNNRSVDLILKRDARAHEYLKRNPQMSVSPGLVGGFHIAYVSEEHVEQAGRDLGGPIIASYAELLGLVDTGNLIAANVPNSYNTTELGGKGIVFAIIDTGIDYLNSTFRYADGTSRIVSIYDQTIEGNAPFKLGVGSEFNQEMINTAIKADNPLSIVPSFDDAGHGTFLASVAAGSKENQFSGIAYDAELMVVKLRKAHKYYLRKNLVPAGQENVFASTDIMLGIDYIIRKSREINRPVIICLGIGSSFTENDRSSLFTQYLSRVSKIKGVCICAAAGNECLAKHHFYGMVPSSGQYQEVKLNISGEQEDVYLTMLNNAPDLLKVSVISPSGQSVESTFVKPGTIVEKQFITEKSYVEISYDFPIYGSGAQKTIIAITNANYGVWTIKVHGLHIHKGDFHMWLPRADLASPLVEFYHPTPNYTITLPGTNPDLITCGAYNTANNHLLSTSSWGPSCINRIKPDLVAPGVNINGIYPNGYGKMSGTGIAAAILSGTCVILMQWKIFINKYPMNTYQARAYLIRGALRSPDFEYPNNQWGYGLLNLYNTLNKMQGIS